MFHIKVWLGVILTAVVTLQLSWMQPQLNRRASEEHERVRPLLASQRFEHGLRKYYIDLGKKVNKIATHKKLRKIVSRLNYDAEDILSKTMNYERVHERLFKKFRLPVEVDAEVERYYIITRDGHILYRSNKPSDYAHDKDKLKHAIAHVDDAFLGRKRTGLWTVEGQTSLVAASPIYNKKKSKGVMAALLYARRFNHKVLTPLNKMLPKGTHIVLFSASRPSKDEEPILTPIAYNTSDEKLSGIFRGWFKVKAYDTILDKYMQGMDRDRLKGTIKEKDYNYMINHFPASLSQGSVGYVLLIPRPQHFFKIDRKNYYQSGGPIFVSLAALLLAFLLATWLSGAEILYFRRILPNLQTAPQENFPNISEKGLSRPWKNLVASVNKIFTLIRERGLGDSDMKPASHVLTTASADSHQAADMGWLSESLDENQVLRTSIADGQSEEKAASFFGHNTPVPESDPAATIASVPNYSHLDPSNKDPNDPNKR